MSIYKRDREAEVHQEITPANSIVFGLRNSYFLLITCQVVIGQFVSPSTLKQKPGVFKSLRFEERSRNIKLCFPDALLWTEGLTVEIIRRFQIFPSIVAGDGACTAPQMIPERK